jgi:pimeloyl-ACP methyl ester carboxylesterase
MPRLRSKISTTVRTFSQLTLLRLRHRIGGWLAPGPTVERAAALFCTPYPGARARALQAPTGAAEIEMLDLEGVQVAEYIWGDPKRQPYVLFAHGWSSHGARLLPWVEWLRAAGYAVVGFDQDGHGRSGGSRTHLPGFTARLLELGRRHGPAAAVIAHSLGGAATALALARGLQADRAILIAPAADPIAAGRRFARQVGLSAPLQRRMFDQFEARLSVRFADLLPERNAPRIGRPVLVVHDLEDREVPWGEGERWARYWPRARLLSTRGLGHHRILDDPQVIAAGLDFLAGRVVGQPVVSTHDLACVA